MENDEKKLKRKKILKISIIVLSVLLTIAIATLTVYFCVTHRKTTKTGQPQVEQEETVAVKIEEPSEDDSIKTFYGEKRPVAVMIDNTILNLSHEHTEYDWVDYETAIKRLRYDSNKTALWELDNKIKLGIL